MRAWGFGIDRANFHSASNLAEINQSATTSKPIHPHKMPVPYLPLERSGRRSSVVVHLDINEAIALSKAQPRFFGAYIESKQFIRYRNALNTFMRSGAAELPVGPLASFICSVMRNYSLQFSGLLSWFARRFSPILSSSTVVDGKLFEDLSSIIALLYLMDSPLSSHYLRIPSC